MIPREIIEEIVYRSDIEQIIGSYVTLKKSGSGLVGLCPFHSEKTPSFSVSVKDRFFYCFGCGAGGDIITFIMKAENLDYIGAVEFLATKAGITIDTDNSIKEANSGVARKRILDMNLEAAKFFRDQLYDKNIGQTAMRYLVEKRQLTMSVIKHFGLGFSPNGFGSLTEHMHKCGYKDEELLTGFLCGKSQKTGKPYDYFRNRIIFPIFDVRGDIVAFGGRIMDDSKPKYLNTSDTPAFKKSKTLYALNYARSKCVEELILCEGYMDVIALHSAGFENSVATLGTSITSEHARMMAKYTKRVIISYDSDSAGKNATEKAIKLLNEVGLDVKILHMKDAKDPDEFITKFGKDKFKAMLSESKTSFEYKLSAILSKYDLTIADDVIKASNEICNMIASVHSDVEREVYISVAADKLKLSKSSMKSDIDRIRNYFKKKQMQKIGRQAQLSAMSIGDRVNPEAALNVRANAAEEAVLGMLMLYPEYRKAVIDGKIKLKTENFVTDFGKKVFEEIFNLENSDGGFMFSMLGAAFNADEMGRLAMIEQKRRTVTRNDIDVLKASIETLKDANSDQTENNWLDNIKKRQEEAKKRRNKSD